MRTVRDGGRCSVLLHPQPSPHTVLFRPRKCEAMRGGRYESSSISSVRLWGAAGPLRSLLPPRTARRIYGKGRL